MSPLWWTATTLLVLGLVGMGLSSRMQRPPEGQQPVPIGLPLEGMLRAMNSPGTTVPSHGTHGYGQTYAVDVIRTDDGARPGAAPLAGADETDATAGPRSVWWPPMRRPEGYPSFGTAVLAVGDGEVVAVHDRQRDHLTRDTWFGYLYFLFESFIRSLGWPRHVLGNHVIIRLDHGVHAAVAHVRQGSARVRIGQRVSRGDVLADCGNSGNSSEPHAHLQLMDGPDVETARGVPFEWAFTPVGADTPTAAPEAGAPTNGTEFRAASVR